ncbi:MAG: M20/M25/M40 family metallo-hydrolase, partial [Burkholderiales bacterium]|nr:M20/M25/M40 family metallo-hydrolase [Burkholderiales bacterium]
MSTQSNAKLLNEAKCEPLLTEWKDEFTKIRKDFHQHPEIGLETPRTSKIIADKLREFGVDEVHENIGGYGVVAIIKGHEDNGKAVGLRADIDALPLQELSEHDHVSQEKGRMHACGHDGHGTVLLSVAKYLA